MPDRWVVISLDAFANLAVGAYGSSWNTTPNIDSVAAAGITWDRAVVPFDDTVQTLRRCWMASSGNLPQDAASPGSQWIEQCQKYGRVELILGNDSTGRDQAQEIAKVAGEVGFDRCTMVEVNLGEEPAEEIESTAIAQLFAALVERLQEADEPESSGTEDGSPWSVLWLHSDLLARHWDAPRWLFPVDEAEDSYEADDESDEDDYEDEAVDESLGGALAFEPPSENFRPPSHSFDLLPDPSFDPTLDGLPEQEEGPPELIDSVTPPSHQIAPDDHPDWVMTWMQTYGCQVRLVDQLIALVAETIKQIDPAIGLAIVGTSGFSFGQNGWIGHRAGPLRSPQIHVPAIISDPSGPMLRWPRLASLVEVIQWIVPNRAAPSPEFWAGLSEFELQSNDPAMGASPEVRTESKRASSAITTGQWFFVRDETATRLYLKPDDRDDVNDVADRCRDVVDEFLAK
jgi:hypothetical protein